MEVEILTRNGGLIRADVALPVGNGPFPALFAASPYQKSLRRLPVHPVFPFRESGPIEFYVDQGYAYVWADVPGSGRSEGTWDPISRAEGEALHDVVEWIAAQPWSNGKVGGVGQSYFSWSQWNVARTRPPHLTTIVPFDGGVDMYRDWQYHGGLPNLGFLSGWLTTVILQHQAEGYPIDGGKRFELLTNAYGHTLDDDWFRARAPFWELDRVTIPVLSVGVWCKGALHLRGNVEGFIRVGGPKQLRLLDARSPNEAQRWFADPEFHRKQLLRWYDHHLKGIDNGVMDDPPVSYALAGSGASRTATSWPPPDGAERSLYLAGGATAEVGSLNDGALTEEAVPADGSVNWSYPDPAWEAGTTAFGPGGRPERFVRVCTFTSEAFARDREFSGDGMFVLFASTDQDDLDVIVKLHIVSGDAPGSGPVRTVSQGWLRASHRAVDPSMSRTLHPFHPHRDPEPLEAGEIYELRVPLVPMAFTVAGGERLMIELSNADSPLYDGRFSHWYGLKVGTDTYHFGGSHPSRLVLSEAPVPDK